MLNYMYEDAEQLDEGIDPSSENVGGCCRVTTSCSACRVSATLIRRCLSKQGPPSLQSNFLAPNKVHN